ncbi:hypothetical protein [Haloprofundus halophilus]|uniref:hypothetical protein n=1 Tax=Haloprofundus halophilus TaxID=2283527 RepID=UPI000E4525FC|nr:hypothetical protein [Haloprofundus halophilus]
MTYTDPTRRDQNTRTDRRTPQTTIRTTSMRPTESEADAPLVPFIQTDETTDTRREFRTELTSLKRQITRLERALERQKRPSETTRQEERR